MLKNAANRLWVDGTMVRAIMGGSNGCWMWMWMVGDMGEKMTVVTKDL